MTPLKIGACLMVDQVADYRTWIFDEGRDLEIQDFIFDHAFEDGFAEKAKAALSGFEGRLGIHGPFIGLDIDNGDAQLQPIIAARYLAAVDAAARIGATQMVMHSPYDLWYKNNRLSGIGYAARKLQNVHAIIGPAVERAKALGVTLVIENCNDPDPEFRRGMVDSFATEAIALSIDTGHAHLARHMLGGPPVDFFVRDAGNQLKHVHIQDLDGHADRHWAPGDGSIEWTAVFKALADCESAPHLVLELRDKADIPKGFAHLRDLGLAI